MTSTTGGQDVDFASRLIKNIGHNAIVEAIQGLFEGDSAWALDWVTNNFDPEEIYSEGILASWAERNGYVKESEA